jgi:hypothetical protein
MKLRANTQPFQIGLAAVAAYQYSSQKKKKRSSIDFA